MRVKPNIDDKQLNIIGERLRAIRKANGIKNQEELAEALDVARETVGQWERGDTPPSLSYLLKICDLYHVDLDYICGRIDCQTHDLQYFHDLTGMSEDAIATVSEWHKKQTHWPNLLSKIIEDAEAHNLMQNLSLYAGTSILSKFDFDEDGHCPGTNDSIKDKNIACLWQISRIFSNIVERLFGK